MRTRVGYAGGTTPSPRYHHLGDHTETLQVDFDPDVIDYETLLVGFWTQHDPTAPVWSRQYASAIWTTDEAQDAAARASRDRLERTLDRPALTEIRRLDRFYAAEPHHQKYRLRSDGLLFAEFRAMLPDDDALRDSTAAARVNGFVGGDGALADLVAEIDSYGLSAGACERLLGMVEARARRPRGAQRP